MNTTETASTKTKIADVELKERHKKIWKQNMWEDFQRFIAFDVIPFALIATIIGCFVLGAGIVLNLLINAASN